MVFIKVFHGQGTLRKSKHEAVNPLGLLVLGSAKCFSSVDKPKSHRYQRHTKHTHPPREEDTGVPTTHTRSTVLAPTGLVWAGNESSKLFGAEDYPFDFPRDFAGCLPMSTELGFGIAFSPISLFKNISISL